MKTPDSLPPILFDPQRRAASAELKAALLSLTAFLEQREAELGLRQRGRKETDRGKFRVAVESIACNLAGLALSCSDFARPLAVPRSSGVMWARGRYALPVYGQHFRDALDLMAHLEVGLIQDVARGYRFASGERQQSTVLPTPAFFGHVPQAMIGWNSFIRAAEPEVLILKGPKDRATGRAEAIAYGDTATTRRRRKEVLRINAWLEKAPLRIVTETTVSGLTNNEEQPIDPHRRALRRIFNNGDWTQGGRLFDGFWENMRRGDRFKFLRICTAEHPEGEAVANVDFGQLFPTLAYLRMNCEPPEGDLYDIGGDGSQRDGWKKLVNALLFATEPLRRWPKDTSQLFPRGAKLRETVEAIGRFHAPIAELFGTGVGFSLMLLESEILIQALGGLYQQGITALPLHDSVLVAGSQSEAALELMVLAFGQFNEGAGRAKLKIEYGL